MKKVLLILTAFFMLAFAPNPDCGDGTVYASAKQTEFDNRFEIYTKIDGVPKFKGGDKKLGKLIRSKLKLSDVAKTQYFMLNYQCTVACDGSIRDIKQLGDPRGDSWTNIEEILHGTAGNWSPAKKDGVPVDCVYFGRLFVSGPQY